MRCGLTAGTITAILLLGMAASSRSAIFAVDSVADLVDASPGDGTCADAGGDCTLRAAIMEANALAGADEIDVPAGGYLLNLAGTCEDLSATGDLDITDDLTIRGAGSGSDTLQDTILIRQRLLKLFSVVSGVFIVHEILPQLSQPSTASRANNSRRLPCG